MTFISVGTHEQGFERLVKEIDRLKGDNIIKDNVFIQIGFTKYIPKNCEYVNMLSYDEIKKKIQGSRIYITHGGPGSIFLGWQYGKIPIVVPRMYDFGEHIDNHQLDFTKRLESVGKILAVYQIERLDETIRKYDVLIKKCNISSIKTQDLSLLVEKLDKFCQELT